MHLPTVPIDFIIITALEEERDAVLAKLPGWRKLDRDGTGPHTYYEANVNTKRADGAVYRVVVTMLSGMGPLKGAVKAGAVIQRWSPEHVLVVGIAGGVSKETAPGDVIVAEQIADYTIGKVRDTGPREERWVLHLADADLIDQAKNFPGGWEDLVTYPRPEAGMPKRRFGIVASGGNVVDSKKQIAIYLEDWPKLVGVEMEGGGVAAGLHDNMARPRFLMVRGVSDLADAENNAETKAAWRTYACDVAAAYTIGLLREGGRPSRQQEMVLNRKREAAREQDVRENDRELVAVREDLAHLTEDFLQRFESRTANLGRLGVAFSSMALVGAVSAFAWVHDLNLGILLGVFSLPIGYMGIAWLVSCREERAKLVKHKRDREELLLRLNKAEKRLEELTQGRKEAPA